ncbi:MAG: hypothetical protein DA328_09980, partial [Nitrososphaeraceae archaeon]|nr:hypothetical protein [Nitrososphaeraceae archaeon]
MSNVKKMIYGQLPIVTIETTDSKDGHHARLLIDGNLDTFYADNLESLGAEIKLTLLKKYRVYGLALNLKEALEPVEYDLSYYQENENAFISIKKGVLDVTEALQVINFSPITTNKLVIKFFTKLTGVGEIRAFGYVEKQIECEYQPTITIPQLPPIAVISSNVSPLNEVIKFPLKVIANFTESVDPNNKKLTFKSFVKQGETVLAESNTDSIKADIKTEGEFTISLEVTDEDQLKDTVSYNFTVVKKEVPEQYDQNGVVIFKEFEYTGIESYNPVENYQQNSRRLDFESPRMDSVICGAYIKATGDDEYSAKLGGGSHNDSKPLNGRCYIIGINFNLTKIRIRLEPDHSKDYITYLEKDISEFGFASGVGRTIGLAYAKINEENGVRLIAWIEPDGLDSEGKPLNNYVKVLDELITDPIWYTPYDVTDFQNTIRVDGQDSSFEYKYAYAREVDGFVPANQEIDIDAGDSQTITTSTLPYQLTLNGTVSGADNFTVLWNSSDSTVNISPSNNLTSAATISTYGSFTFTLSATTSTRTESDSITVTVVEPSTSTDVLKFIKDGQEVQFKLTGKKV